jgi:thioredoxin reductase (NADPH)
LRTIVLEELACGGQSLVIDVLENYPGLGMPVTGFEFADGMRAQAEKFGARIENTGARSLRKEGAGFLVETYDGTLRAGAVVLATGAAHRRLGVPGEAELSARGVSYCATCDGPFFKGKRMLVVGGGDAACDEASFLAKLSDKITMIHRRDRFRAQPALASRVLSNPSISVRWNAALKEIRGQGKVESVLLADLVTGAVEEIPADAVFIFVGSDPRTQLAPGAAKDEGGYLVTDQRMETSIPGLFAAGDVRASPFRQVVVAAAEGAVAAHCAATYVEASREGAGRGSAP